MELGISERAFRYTVAPGESFALAPVLFYDFESRLDMDAYKNLCNITSTSLADFEKELDSAVESAKQHFKEEESPVYYLPQDLLYY